MKSKMSNRTIPLFVPYWDEKEKNAVLDVLNGDYILEHKKTREFEEKFASFVGARYCILCTSGTIALYLAIKAKAKQLIGTVSIPDLVGNFAGSALIMAGITPDLTDVGKNGSLKKQITNAITVHNNGRLGIVDMIEDCCQIQIHHTKNKVSCYSFASTKHITLGAQGGAVCCDDRETFDMLTRLKDHGRTDRQNLRAPSDNYEHWGSNFKMTEIQSAFGLVQLQKLPKRMDRLHEIYSHYKDELKNHVEFFDEEPKWYCDILVKEPERLVEFLNKNGIMARRFHKPTHKHPLYNQWQTEKDEWYKNAISIYERGVFLPSTTNLQDGEINYIILKIKEFYR
jgi:perosamine synthetase